MLPKANRLKKKKDFEAVFKKGRGARECFLFFKFTKNGLPSSRFGFVVGKNVSKKATTRNKIKRKIREAVKKEINNIKPGFDGAWVVLQGVKKEDLKKTEEVVKKIIQKSMLNK